ncbi:MAG: FkbM family methyltransferase [Hyperionvirus sp.]|uniref:FkbM family methyltransferase n=1 Tax=Hyperionvirus sp. TaxID=2487770 RepID=A0A3G5A8B3_9VIRU|nr:MAG: FkbM family methyltransferase [Hyperionvirus sp.]
MNNKNTFDWITYVSKYEDLKKAGINTKEKAWNHWIVHGSKEGRKFYNIVNKDNDPDKLNIIYQVGSTSTITVNSGIQRVVRLLGKYFDKKCNLYLVKFDYANSRFINISSKERRWLEIFNGIPYNPHALDLSVKNKWFFNGEISYDFAPIKPIFDEARRNNMKIAAIFYDDIQYKMHESYPAVTQHLYKKFIDNLLEVDLIFPISHYSHTRLLSHIDINYKKIPQIVPCILPGEFPNIDRNYNYNITLHNKYHILCIGVINSRKNQIRLLEAVNQLKDKYNIQLTLVGQIPYNSRLTDILKLIKSNNVIRLENISDDQLKTLYQNSHLSVFPSVEEGFGLPILESLWNCRPCICMNDGAMNEIATGGCLKVDCNDPKKIADAIEKILFNDPFREKLIDEIKNMKFKTWNEYADEIIGNISNFQ